MVFCLNGLVQLGEGVAAVQLGFGIVRLYGQSEGERRHRLFRLAECVQRRAAQALRRREQRIRRKRLQRVRHRGRVRAGQLRPRQG